MAKKREENQREKDSERAELYQDFCGIILGKIVFEKQKKKTRIGEWGTYNE